MRRFWFEFDENEDFVLPTGIKMGCGITALDKDEAKSILQNTVFKGYSEIPIKKIIEDIDIRDLDQNHIIPNMGIVSRKGVWFPLGYM